jgi:HSP20 family protein
MTGLRQSYSPLISINAGAPGKCFSIQGQCSKEEDSQMATVPVAAKQSAPSAVGHPEAWRSLRSEMDRLFDRFTGGFGMMPFPALRTEPTFGIGFPAVDVAEDETSFKLSAELPGMADKDIQVALSGDTLTIRGEKRQDKEEKKSGYHLSERSYGEFQRAFTLPDGVDGEKIAAAFANGVLTVTVPKKAQAVAKKIQVKAA